MAAWEVMWKYDFVVQTTADCPGSGSTKIYALPLAVVMAAAVALL